MTEEPRDSFFGATISEYIAGKCFEAQCDGVAFAGILDQGRRGYGYEGEALLAFLRRVLTAMMEAGAHPVLGGNGTEYSWLVQKQYGERPAEIAENVVRAWVAQGMPDDAWLSGWLWFTVEDNCEPHPGWKDGQPPGARDRGAGLIAFNGFTTVAWHLDEEDLAFWLLASEGRRRLGHEAEALLSFLREALHILLKQGARPVLGGPDGARRARERYGEEPSALIEAVLREWADRGMREEEERDWLWFRDRGRPD